MLKVIKLLAILVMMGIFACHNKAEKGQEIPKITRDEKFNKLFHKDTGGLTGADGSISVAMPDGSSVFMMGDSFLGEVINDRRDSNTTMINNTFVVVNPKKTDARTLFNGTYKNPESFLIPENAPGKFYWPGHGFVRDSIFHFFMARMWNPGKDMWGFKFLNTDYFRYSWPDFKPISVTSFKYSLADNVHWGQAVLDNGNFIYIYGTHTENDNIARAYVCKTKINGGKALDLDKVEFFDGTDWTTDPLAVKPMQGTTGSISEQFSVFKYKAKYILLSQLKGIGTGEIFTYTSEQPYGPWGNKRMVYRTTESDNDKDIITYNAMAHPQYIENDQLLICYNVNSLKVNRIHSNVNNYRPVFLRVPMKLILGEMN